MSSSSIEPPDDSMSTDQPPLPTKLVDTPPPQEVDDPDILEFELYETTV